MNRFLLFLILVFSFPVFAEENIWDEEDVFKTKIPDHETYSPFDILSEEKRYEKNPIMDFNLSDETNDTEFSGNIPKMEIVKSKDFISPDEGRFFANGDIVLLNKVTAKSKQITIPVGGSEYFGNIEVELEKCWYNGDLYNPSHKILLKVTQHKIDEDPHQIYYGWLISSNIPICNMQSPTYEIIAMKCHDKIHKAK